MSITGKSIVGFSHSNFDAGKSVKAVDPATGAELEPPFLSVGASVVEEAAQLAASAFDEYSKLSGVKRAAFLNAIADEIEALGDQLTQQAMLESGLPEGRIKGDPNTGGPRLWTRQDGSIGANFEIVADTVRFLSARGEESGYSGGDGGGDYDGAPAQEEDDIPF